jgi:hypothetical protein
MMTLGMSLCHSIGGPHSSYARSPETYRQDAHCQARRPSRPGGLSSTEGRPLDLGGGEPRMRHRRFIPKSARSLVAASITILSLAGCGDDSRTTGSMLQMSPEAKAAQKDMREAMREQRKERQAERKAKGKRGIAKVPITSKDAGKASQ